MANVVFSVLLSNKLDKSQFDMINSAAANPMDTEGLSDAANLINSKGEELIDEE